jgi:hypothetical protein
VLADTGVARTGENDTRQAYRRHGALGDAGDVHHGVCRAGADPKRFATTVHSVYTASLLRGGLKGGVRARLTSDKCLTFPFRHLS